jgi:protein transport protein SEC31
LQDPSSGRNYYANQTTGETTWERPPLPQPTATPPTTSSPTATTAPTPSKAKLVSKYGDGFVTSASHPELASQYGNHGTSNPYSASRPGTAAAVVKSANAQPVESPPSEPIDLATAELTTEQRQVIDMLLSLHDYLLSVAHASERRQLEEAKSAIDALGKKFSRGAIDSDIEAKLVSMSASIGSRDFRSATAIQTALVSHEWKVHKDWLKGLKLILQLGAKKV